MVSLSKLNRNEIKLTCVNNFLPMKFQSQYRLYGSVTCCTISISKSFLIVGTLPKLYNGHIQMFIGFLFSPSCISSGVYFYYLVP